VWHLDDLKNSHKPSSVVDEVIASLKSEHGKDNEMTIRCRQVHEYLRMTLGSSLVGKFIINMEGYMMIS